MVGDGFEPSKPEASDLQSDVFDHLYSVMPEFDLLPYQQPAGRNISQAAKVMFADKNQGLNHIEK